MKNYLFILFIACVLGSVQGFAQQVTQVTAIQFTVQDMKRELAFFEQVLHFKKVSDVLLPATTVDTLYPLSGHSKAARRVTLQLGSEQIRLIDFDTMTQTLAAQLEFNEQTRGNDRWFQHIAIVVSNMDSAYQHLLRHQVTHVSTAPQTLPTYLPAAAGIRAFYFRDPEGHNLELIAFPSGKGQARWHQPATSLFLGIDHTAITIAGHQQSMDFYAQKLGFRHSGHSENYGNEQEHLNQVFGARLDINGLHAPSGPGVEFLRYIAPPGGRSYPANTYPNDLWFVQTELVVDDLRAMLRKLREAGYTQVSIQPVKVENRLHCACKDPDGHAVLLVQQ